MPKLRLRRTSIQFPRKCACCLRATQEGLDLYTTKTRIVGPVTVGKTLTLRVPYCSDCRAHAAWYQDLGIFGKTLKTIFVVLLGTAVFSFIVWALTQRPDHSVPPLATSFLMPAGGLVAAGLGIFYLYKQWGRRPRRLGPEHSSRAVAVWLAGFTPEDVTIGFTNEEFARMVERPTAGAQG